jgi:hypothetical protein
MLPNKRRAPFSPLMRMRSFFTPPAKPTTLPKAEQQPTPSPIRGFRNYLKSLIDKAGGKQGQTSKDPELFVLMELSNNELFEIIDKGYETKGEPAFRACFQFVATRPCHDFFCNLSLSSAIAAGGVFEKRGDCWLSLTNKKIKDEMGRSITIKVAEAYPEFNSNVLTTRFPERSVKWKLYRVGATLNFKRVWSEVPLEELKAFVRNNKLNASHLCRRRIEVAKQTNPDGTINIIYGFEENKACFNPDHLILEDAKVNQSRKNCSGGEECTHYPKCLISG